MAVAKGAQAVAGTTDGARGWDKDVVIVGSGPTGSTLALALATYGVRAHIVSRTRWLADSPRAHITNLRTMEVFRDLGIEDEVLAQATSWAVMGDTMFTTSLAGEELVRLRTWGTGDDRHGDYRSASPCSMGDVVQPKLEPILFKNAAARGASFAFGTEYLGHEQNADGVTVTLRDRLLDHVYTLRCGYLFGADGANSRIAADLNLPIEGEMGRAGTIYTQFAADLTDLVEHRPSILNWIVTPDASYGEIGMALLRAVRPWTHWIAGWGFDMKRAEPDLDPGRIHARIVTMIGDPKVSVTIERSSVWYVNQAYATCYSTGRVFCGGDAVHRHPPSSGLGMNTCVQDAYNLAWKLALVIRGEAAPELLDSYTLERAPIGKQIVLRANQSRADYAPLNACFRVPGADNPVAAGIARFKSPTPDGVAARRAVQDALALKNTEFNALGTELNQRYASAAVISEPDGEPEVFARDPGLHFQASTRPGARVPHVWLVDENGRRTSSIDLCGGGCFTLITGLAGEAWDAAATTLASPLVRVVVIGSARAQDVYCDWQRVREIDEDGALLVRPDGYVGWRAMHRAKDAGAARDALAQALRSVLGRDRQGTSGRAKA